MKKIIILSLLVAITHYASAQNKWFSTYNDSVALVSDANLIIHQMEEKARLANPDIQLHKNIAIKHTTPYLIYIHSAAVNLPMWDEVIPQQKDFFATIGGGEAEGRKIFGLFFNGFYLAHELGHSIAASAGKEFDNSFDSEYDANIIGVLYWRSTDKKDELEKCYEYAKKILATLKSPVPENEDFKKYITRHYNELASDPYKYGYIQFSQFAEVYEDKNLPDFDTYIRGYLK